MHELSCSDVKPKRELADLSGAMGLRQFINPGFRIRLSTALQGAVLGWVVGASLVASAWSAPAVVSQGQKEQAKATFLIQLQRKLPKLFDEMEYAVGLMDLLDEQERLLNVLPSDPGRSADSTASKALKVVIRSNSESLQNAYRVRPEVFEQWRSGLSESLKGRAAESPASKAFTQSIRDALEATQGQRSTNLLTGLAQLLPPERRGEIYKAESSAEKIEKLRTALSGDLPPSFLAQNGFGAEVRSGEVFDRLEQLLRIEERLARNTQAYLLFMAQPNAESASVAQASERLSNLDPSEMERLNDRKFLDPALERLKVGLKAEGQRFRENELKDAVMQDLKAVSSRSKEVVRSSSRELHLEQISADVAIFRGCPGGDCSSSMSFPFPNDPAERVLLVSDGGGAVKGYVEGTHVLVGGKPAFYLNTINGPGLSKSDAYSIFHAFTDPRLLSELGVGQILVPRSKAIEDLNNYPELSAAFQEQAKGKRAVRLSFPSAKVRSKIEGFKSPFHSLDYDHMASNRTAIPLSRESLGIMDGTKTLEISRVSDVKWREPVTPDEIKSTLLKISSPPQMSRDGVKFFNRMATALGENPASYLDFRKELHNVDELPSAEFVQRVRKLAQAQLKVDIPESSEVLTLGKVIFAADSSSPGKEKAFFDELGKLLGTKPDGSLFFSINDWDLRVRLSERLSRLVREQPELLDDRPEWVSRLLRAENEQIFNALLERLFVRPQWLESWKTVAQLMSHIPPGGAARAFPAISKLLQSEQWLASKDLVSLLYSTTKGYSHRRHFWTGQENPAVTTLKSKALLQRPDAMRILSELIERLKDDRPLGEDILVALSRESEWKSRLAPVFSLCGRPDLTSMDCIRKGLKERASDSATLARSSEATRVLEEPGDLEKAKPKPKPINGKQWLVEWKKAGSPESSAELDSLARFIDESAKSGKIVKKLKMGDLIWDGSKWQILPGVEVRDGLTAEEVVKAYRKRLPKSLSVRCPALFQRLAQP